MITIFYRKCSCRIPTLLRSTAGETEDCDQMIKSNSGSPISQRKSSEPFGLFEIASDETKGFKIVEKPFENLSSVSLKLGRRVRKVRKVSDEYSNRISSIIRKMVD